MRSHSRAVATLLVATATAACTGIIDDPTPSGSDPTGPGPSTSQPLCVDGSIDVGPSPLRRLTRVEYDNTVRDLLGDASAPARSFVPDEQAGGFDANSVAAISETQAEQYLDAAETLATAYAPVAIADLGCDVMKTACVEPLLRSFGKRAFRRPLAAESLQTFVDLYESSRASWDAPTGVRLAIQAMLVSPQFLYHVEVGLPGAADAVVALDPYELASRLSYFLWQSMPDDALLAAAEAGELDTTDGIEAQARRLLQDPRAEGGIASFHAQWLELGALDDLTKDTAAFPGWTPGLAGSMRKETLRFVDEVVRQGDGRLETLLTASFSFVNADLAPLYGVASPAGGGFARVELDPAQRAGILTHAGFLAGHAHATEPSWVHRGKFVRERLLCQAIPAPPADVDMSKLQDPDRLKNPACRDCHLQMDPIGYGFDQYDAIGRFGAGSAKGEVLDPSGELDVSGEFEGAVDLAHDLAGSADVRACVAEQWMRFAVRRAHTDADACAVSRVADEFVATGDGIGELLVAIAKSDLFRYRRAPAN